MSLSSQWVVVVNPFLICLFENEGTEEPWDRKEEKEEGEEKEKEEEEEEEEGALHDS